MPEFLAIPAQGTPSTKVDAWVAKLGEGGTTVAVSRESATVTWLEMSSIRVRGYAVIENGHAAAINFELFDADPEPATKILEAAATSLGWELHPDDPDDPDDDDDDDDD